MKINIAYSLTPRAENKVELMKRGSAPAPQPSPEPHPPGLAPLQWEAAHPAGFPCKGDLVLVQIG